VDKTAEQIADQVIEKVAVSPELALKAIVNRAQGWQQSRYLRDRPASFVSSVAEDAPRAYEQATSLFKKSPGLFDRIKTFLNPQGSEMRTLLEEGQKRNLLKDYIRKNVMSGV
jgi:hypothetical protein